MEGIWSELPNSVLWGAVFILLLVPIFLISKKFVFSRERKNLDSKVLLKELLEDLSLDVPIELQNLNKNVLKSFKKT
tara:strand:+ start:73 stop:303 length:231 start_codon:yes stop_codon:yes gene_type:complete